MTFQPPPPPPPPPAGPPPGSQPPGAWGPPPGGAPRPAFNPSAVNPLDWAILGIGAIIFIFSFFGYYTWNYGFGSISLSAWHFSGGTFIAWIAMILAVIAAVVVALELFMPTLTLPVANRLAAFGLFAISFVLYIIAIFAHSDFGPDGGHGFSFWLSLVLAAAGAVLCLMRAQQTGTAMPGALAGLPNLGQHGPQGHAIGQQPPAAPGYGAPPQYGQAPQYGQPPQQDPGAAAPPPGYGPPRP